MALALGTTSLACGGATLCSSGDLARILDAFAYGSQSGTFTGEGNSQAPALSNTTAARPILKQEKFVS